MSPLLRGVERELPKLRLVVIASGYRDPVEGKIQFTEAEIEITSLRPFCWVEEILDIQFISTTEGTIMAPHSQAALVRRDTFGALFLDDPDRVRRIIARWQDLAFFALMTPLQGRASTQYVRLEGVDVPVVLFSGRSPSALLHELGHSLGLLGDEYPAEVRHPAGNDNSPNLLEFEGSPRDALHLVPWAHFLDLPEAQNYDWLHEVDRGVFSPWEECIMRSGSGAFCPVCSESILREVFLVVGLPWDDETYHRAYPLSTWTEH